MNKIRDLSKYKGLIVIGSARSGTHMVCDMLYQHSTIPNKVNLYEIDELPAASDQFIFASIAKHGFRNLLAANLSWASDYYIVSLRRRDKVAQYLSLCMLRAQHNTGNIQHDPVPGEFNKHLPWRSCEDDLLIFLADQHIDFAFTPSEILYYEAMAVSGMFTEFKKNPIYLEPEEIVTDYALVKSILGNYSYNDR